LWSALRHHKAVAAIQKFKHALLNRTAASGGLPFDLNQSDNASGNDLYHAATCLKDPATWIKDQQICMNHQTQHSIIIFVVVTFGMQVVSALYTIVAFISMGTHLVRCLLALPGLLSTPGAVTVIDGAPSDADKLFATELIDYMVTNREGTDSVRKKYKNRLEELFSYWTGGYTAPGDKVDAVIFKVHSMGRDLSLDAIRILLLGLCESVVFSHLPVRPILSKWLQLGQCLNWMVLAFTGGLLPYLLVAFTDLSAGRVNVVVGTKTLKH